MSHRSSQRGVVIALIACTLLACAAPVQADAIAPVQAIWRVQQLELRYDSAYSSYSCAGLERKIRSILQMVGAHPSVAVQTRCSDTGPVSVAHVAIAWAAPVEATEQNIRAATSFAPHEVLAARLRRIALPTSGDIERFAASWEPVSLAPLRLDTGDCDLLRELHRHVFPKLRVRGAQGFDCPVAATRVRPSPRVEALLRVAIEDSLSH